MEISMKRWASAVVVCAVALWSGPSARVVSPEIVISQIYGGGGNSGATYTHDFVELFNRGTSAVDVTGWSVQYASATGTGNFGSATNLITPIAGTIPPGGYLLIQESSTAAVGAVLPPPDVIDASPILMSGTAGKIALVRSGTSLGCNGGSALCTPDQQALIVDLVGYGGANFFEAQPTGVLSNTTAAIRRDGGCTETDHNFNDFEVLTPAPRNSATPLASCNAPDAAPSVSSVSPSNGVANVGPGANLVVTFNEPVTVTGAWFTLTCSLSGNKTAVVTGGPAVFTLNPTVDFSPDDQCTLTIIAGNITDQDTADPPDVMAANVASSFTVINPCTGIATPTFAIQGPGATAAITGSVLTRGVVIADYEGAAPALRGFYIQDAAGDGNTATSDGLFVFNGNNNSVSLGNVVAVSGTVSEFQGQTQLSATSVTVCGSGGTIAPVDVMLPVPSATFLERYEGMLVMLPQPLVVTETFFLGRFGEVTVASGGRLAQPTEVTSPGALANALQAQNDLNRLIIDDATNASEPNPVVFARGGAPLSAANTLRGGDLAVGTTGVMTFTWAGNNDSGNAWRVRPPQSMNGAFQFVAANQRPAGAPARAASLRVATMNVLNFFNTFGPAACTLGVGGSATGCRGANDGVEFARQWPKTVAAILGSDADIVGVVEIENDGYGQTSALQFLIDRLNAATSPGTYAFIDADQGTGQVNALGTDAIKVGILYKPARVITVGQTAALNTVEFVNAGDNFPRNRPALAQAFEEFGTGARFVYVVNHFKSKGSACNAPDANDGQGNCNAVRVSAASQLSAWLAADPTGTGDPDVLIAGDLNAYRREDPIVILEQTGYQNLVPQSGGGPSYVFQGQWGSLDHALASTTLRPQIARAWEWAINADEPIALDYNVEERAAALLPSLCAPNEFRMADHNPVLVDLALARTADTSAEASAGAHLVLEQPGGTAGGDVGSMMNLTLTARFKKGAITPDGQAQVMVRLTEQGVLRTYQIKADALTAFVVDGAGRATIVARATIVDVTDPGVSRLVDAAALIRITVADQGEPGAGSDTVAVTVVDGLARVWFSSRWDGVKTIDQTISGGNVNVR
jgi:predicted extracellular nuclease